MKQDKLKILFLDVDGVLNCKSTPDRCYGYIGIEDEKVNHLKRIVEETSAKIVLISSWKEYWKKNPYKSHQDCLANYLDKKLAKQGLIVVDKTIDLYGPTKRGQGILDYLYLLNRYGLEVDNYVILDDLSFDYKKANLTNNLVKTTYRNGLKEKHVQAAINILNNRKEN